MYFILSDGKEEKENTSEKSQTSEDRVEVSVNKEEDAKEEIAHKVVPKDVPPSADDAPAVVVSESTQAPVTAPSTVKKDSKLAELKAKTEAVGSAARTKADKLAELKVKKLCFRLRF